MSSSVSHRPSFSTLLAGLLLFLVFGVAPATQAQPDIYVDASAGGAEDGTSWTDAYTSLQEGLSAATSGDVIWVAAGTYYPDEGPSVTTDSRSESFSLTDGVKVFGGFSGGESSLSGRDLSSGKTLLSGEIQQDGDASNNAYHIVEAGNGVTSTAALDGVVIEGGNASGSGEDGCGGGLRLDGSTARLQNLTLSENKATEGGGLCLAGGAAPQAANLSVTGNTAEYGGGIYAAGSSSGTFTQVTIAGNEATTEGGGVYASGSSPKLENAVIWGNTSAGTEPSIKNVSPTYTISGDIGNQDGKALTGDITVTEPDGNTATVATDSDGEFTATVQPLNGFEDGETVDVTATNVTNYQDKTKQVALDNQNTSKSTSFDLDVSQSTLTTTISDFTIVGDDLYTGGYDDDSNLEDNGELDQVTLTSDLETETITSPGQSVTVTYGDTLSTVNVSQDDADFINTWVMNNTSSETAPDLRKDYHTSFPDEPDFQSNYGQSTTTGPDTINVAPSTLDGESYEARVIPEQSPGDYDTLSEYEPHIGDPNLFNGVNRWTDLGGYSEVEIYVEKGNSNSWQNHADDVLTTLTGLDGSGSLIPVPTDTLQLTESELLNRTNNRNGNNTVRLVEDSKGYSVQDKNRFMQGSRSAYSDSNVLKTAQEETYGGLSNLADGSGPNIMDSLLNNGNFDEAETEWVYRALYSIHSTSQIE